MMCWYYQYMRSTTTVKVADEVWLAAALLHREYPQRADFTVQEIVERARRERIHPELRPGVQVHAYRHCVANVPPDSGRYRMLFATGKTTRRLYRTGDPTDPARRRGKSLPAREDIPADYHELLTWYAKTYAPPIHRDPSLGLRGLGKQIWRDEKADAYVRRLREGWS